MTDTELDTLEAKARAATSEWGWELDTEKYTSVNDQIVKDSAYIAVATPTAILELIAELRQTRKERDWLAEQLEEAMFCCKPKNEECSCDFCSDCEYRTKEGWLKATKEVVNDTQHQS